MNPTQTAKTQRREGAAKRFEQYSVPNFAIPLRLGALAVDYFSAGSAGRR
jgi:hypothetical protein